MPKDTITVRPELTEEQRLFIPSQKENEVVTSVFSKFRDSANDRDQGFEYFDGDNLIDYIDDSVRRYNTNVDERDNIEDWQARIHDKFTRNKVLAILGKVVSVLPIAQFTGRGDEDIRKGIILTNLYEYSEEADDYEEFMLHYLLEAIVKGTAVGYDGVDKKKRKLRDVSNFGDEIKTKEVTEITTKLYSTIVPLEEFYPSNVGIRNISKMPYCFWRKVVPYSSFMERWSGFSKSSLVQAKRTHSEETERPYYLDYISSDVSEGGVEIIRYYNRDEDQYVVIANGIWLNPIMGKNGQEVISPLPFNHKELPFFDVKFDFFGDFFYGKSLPDRLKTMQDVLNVLTNMLLDQSFLTIFPPMLTNGFDGIEDDYLRPGRRTPIDTQGLPISQAFMKLDLGTPSGWHQYILEYTRKIMEESSVDQVSQGIAGVGERTTAQEIRVAAEGVSAMLGLFGRMVNYGIKRKALLRGANILQFWTDKNSPMLQKVLGENGRSDFNKVFNVFKMDSATLTNGKRGVKIIELYSNKKDMPTARELKVKGSIFKKESGKNIEIMALPGEYLRDFQYDIKLVPNVKSETTKDMEKAMQLEKVRVYMSFFPQLVNVNELAAQTAEKMGDDPTKVLNDEVFNPPPVENKELDSGMSTEPTTNQSNNMVRSARGGEGMAQLAQLSNSMLG